MMRTMMMMVMMMMIVVLPLMLLSAFQQEQDCDEHTLQTSWTAGCSAITMMTMVMIMMANKMMMVMTMMLMMMMMTMMMIFTGLAGSRCSQMVEAMMTRGLLIRWTIPFCKNMVFNFFFFSSNNFTWTGISALMIFFIFIFYISTWTGISALMICASTVPLPCCFVPTTVWDSTIVAGNGFYLWVIFETQAC